MVYPLFCVRLRHINVPLIFQDFRVLNLKNTLHVTGVDKEGRLVHQFLRAKREAKKKRPVHQNLSLPFTSLEAIG